MRSGTTQIHDAFIYWQYLDKTPGPLDEIMAIPWLDSMGATTYQQQYANAAEQMSPPPAQHCLHLLF